MPEFILSKRADLPNYYISIQNPLTGNYSTKRCSGTSNKKEAEKIAYKWLLTGKFEKTEKYSSKSLIDAFKMADLTVKDTTLIIEILKQKELLVSAVIKNDRSDIPFTTFLSDFWDYETSPYIREKLRKKHSIHKRSVVQFKKKSPIHYKEQLITEIT